MRYTRLGQTGLDVSVIALGCGNFGGIGSLPELFGKGEDETQAFALLDAAHEHGITLLDTANSYGGGRSESWIGRWLATRRCRDEMVLTTKVRNPMGPGQEGLSAGQIRTQIDLSLRRLGTDWIDLYLAHAPDPAVPIEETLGAFDALVSAGKIRHYGLSNYTGEEIADAVRIAETRGLAAPANLQSGYSLLEPAAEALAACTGCGVAFTAHSPLAGGWLSGKYRPGQPPPPDSRMALRPDPYLHYENQSTHAAIARLAAVAENRGLTLPTLALAWVLADPAVSSVITGPRRPEQLGPAIDALRVQLDSTERAEVAFLTQRA